MPTLQALRFYNMIIFSVIHLSSFCLYTKWSFIQGKEPCNGCIPNSADWYIDADCWFIISSCTVSAQVWEDFIQIAITFSKSRVDVHFPPVVSWTLYNLLGMLLQSAIWRKCTEMRTLKNAIGIAPSRQKTILFNTVYAAIHCSNSLVSCLQQSILAAHIPLRSGLSSLIKWCTIFSFFYGRCALKITYSGRCCFLYPTEVSRHNYVF